MPPDVAGGFDSVGYLLYVLERSPASPHELRDLARRASDARRERERAEASVQARRTALSVVEGEAERRKLADEIEIAGSFAGAAQREEQEAVAEIAARLHEQGFEATLAPVFEAMRDLQAPTRAGEFFEELMREPTLIERMLPYKGWATPPGGEAA